MFKQKKVSNNEYGKKETNKDFIAAIVICVISFIMAGLLMTGQEQKLLKNNEDSYTIPDIYIEDNISVSIYEKDSMLSFVTKIGDTGYLIDTLTNEEDRRLTSVDAMDQLSKECYFLASHYTNGVTYQEFQATLMGTLYSNFKTDGKLTKLSTVSGYINGYKANGYQYHLKGCGDTAVIQGYEVILSDMGYKLMLMVVIQKPTSDLLQNSMDYLVKTMYTLRIDEAYMALKEEAEANYQENEKYYQQLDESIMAAYESGNAGNIVEDVPVTIRTPEQIAEDEKNGAEAEKYYSSMEEDWSGSTGIYFTENDYSETVPFSEDGSIYVMIHASAKYESAVYKLKSPDLMKEYELIKSYTDNDTWVGWFKIDEPIVGTYTLIMTDIRKTPELYYFYPKIWEN